MRSFVCLFFNDAATTEIYTLSLHDALPISSRARLGHGGDGDRGADAERRHRPGHHRRRGRATAVRAHVRVRDRKSTRLNSSHGYISYAVFCLKKKKKTSTHPQPPHARDPAT